MPEVALILEYMANMVSSIKNWLLSSSTKLKPPELFAINDCKSLLVATSANRDPTLNLKLSVNCLL